MLSSTPARYRPSAEGMHVNIIQQLKRTPAGMTVAEIRQVCGTATPQVIELLQKGESIVYIAETDRFIYKSSGLVASTEQLREALRTNYPLLIGSNLLSDPPYPELQSDISSMQASGEIFVVNKTNKEGLNLFASPISFTELNAPTEVPAFVKDLWENIVKKPDTFKQLREYLLLLGQNPANLACNVATHLTTNVEQKKKAHRSGPRRTKKIDENTAMSAIAKALATLFFDNESAKISPDIDVEDEDDENQSEEARKAKMFLLHHNKDADPDEFDAVTQLVILIGKWFYSDSGAVLLQWFLEQKIRKSVDLIKDLGATRALVDSTLAKLRLHQMLVEYNFDGPQTLSGTRSYSIFTCDLNLIVDAINYRICSIRRHLRTKMTNAENQVFSCPTCNRSFSQVDMALLEKNTVTNSYTCPQCLGRLQSSNPKEQVNHWKSQLQQFEEFVRPAVLLLQRILPQNATSTNWMPQTPGFSMSTPATPSTSTQKKPGSVSAKRSGMAMGYRSTPMATPRSLSSFHSVPATPNTPALPPPAPVVEVIPEFPLKPLLFDSNHPRDVYLHAIEDASVLRDDHAYQMAKVVLDDTALFIEIVSRSFPQYGIDTEKKFFQFRYSWESLFLAAQRGYRPQEIVRLLSLLAPEDKISQRLQMLIMDYPSYTNYYAVVVQLLSDKQGHPQHWLCSRDLPQMTKLMGIGGIRLAIDPDYLSKYETKGDYPYCVPLSHKEKSTTIESIKSMAERAGVHIIDEFNFSENHGPDDKELKFGLVGDYKIREYQKVATERIFWNPLRAHSGILVLPCGAGKTLIGVNIMAAIKRPTIIFCQSSLAVNQWYDQVKKFTNLQGYEIFRFASLYMKKSAPPSDDVPVVIATYSMFSTTDGKNRAAASNRIINRCRTRRWGLMILDEVHQAPAETFREVTNGFKVHVKIGLTATLVREDEGVLELPRLVGPKLFELDIFTLRMQNHISVVNCHEIQCPMSISYQALYDACGGDGQFGSHKKDSALMERRLLFITNLNKVRVCAALVKKHLAMNHKIMIFCDDLFGLRWYSLMLQKHSIQGETQMEARRGLISNFRKQNKGDCLLFSRVGDQSIDLPQANVVIQIAITTGSRMQELQRVGRVQRPAPGKTGAFFYSLVSVGTAEVEFAARRRQYLEQHGYQVQVHNAHNDFNTFLEGQDMSMLTPDKIEALERLMGKTIKSEMAKRSAESTRKKGASAESGLFDSVMLDVAETLGVTQIPDLPEPPVKRGAKRKTPDVKTEPGATASPFTAPAPKKPKTEVSASGTKFLSKMTKQARKK